MHSVRQIGLPVAATVTSERSQLIGRVNMVRRKNCDTPTPSMGVRDFIRYKKCAKLFIHLRSDGKSVTTRFAT